MAARRPPADEPQQPVPKVTAADVERVLARDYAAADLDEARRIVGGIDVGAATARVRLAVLKLADRDLARLRHWAREAMMDYRDVLSPAEYPRCGREGEPLWEMSPEKRREVFDEDWRQYEAWLGRGATSADPAGPPRDGGTRRRRLLVWLAALLVLGGSAVFAVTRGDDGPLLHFWVRDGDDPPRLYDAPDGHEIGGFSVRRLPREGGRMLRVGGSSDRDPVRRLLRAVGLRQAYDFVVFGIAVDRGPSVTGWREYLVLSPDLTRLDASVEPRPDLAGEWEADSEQGAVDVPRFDVAEKGSRRWRLRVDGGAVPVYDDADALDDLPVKLRLDGWEWGVIGDVLVIKPTGAWPPLDMRVLSADGRSARNQRGFVMRKLR